MTTQGQLSPPREVSWSSVTRTACLPPAVGAFAMLWFTLAPVPPAALPRSLVVTCFGLAAVATLLSPVSVGIALIAARRAWLQEATASVWLWCEVALAVVATLLAWLCLLGFVRV